MARRQGTSNLAGSSRSRRLLYRMPPLIAFSIGVLLLCVAVATFAPVVAPHRPTAQSLKTRLQPPLLVGGTATHILGTDQLGRDISSRLIYSLRTTLLIASIGTIIGASVGIGLGLLSGLAGGTVDDLIMFLVDVQLAVPFTLAALTAIALFGTSLTVLVPVVGLAGWSSYARLARGEVLRVRSLLFVEAVEAMGGSGGRVALRHILPNISSSLIVLATYTFSQIMLLESALSFLGLGVQPPSMSLGLMVGAGRDYLMTAWWVAVGPAIVLVVITMALALVGDWLRDTLDPRQAG